MDDRMIPLSVVREYMPRLKDEDLKELGSVEYDQDKVPEVSKKHAENVRRKVYLPDMTESFARGVEYAGLIASEAVDISNETKGRQDTVETQFNSVQQEMTDKDVISAPEIIAARDGETNLKARLDKEKQEVNAQLAQIGIDVMSFGRLSNETNDNGIFERAISEATSKKLGLIVSPNKDGYQITEPIKIDQPLEVTFSGKQSIIYQNKWSVPVFDIRSPNVTFKGEMVAEYVGNKTVIVEPYIPEVNVDPKAYCSGVFLFDGTDNFKANIINVKNFVSGLTHVGESNGIDVGKVFVDEVDFGVFGNGMNNSHIDMVIGDKIINTQNEPEHLIYLTAIPEKSKNFSVGLISCSELEGANSVVSVRNTENFYIESIHVDRVGEILHVENANGSVGYIIGDTHHEPTNDRANITIDSGSDVFIGVIDIDSKASYYDASTKSYAISASNYSTLTIDKAIIEMTALNSNSAFYFSNSNVNIYNPEIKYLTSLDSTIYPIQVVATSDVIINNPILKNANKLLFKSSTAKCKVYLNPDNVGYLDHDGVTSNIPSLFDIRFLSTQSLPMIIRENYGSPYISSSNFFKTNNTNLTKIINFRFGSNNQEFTVLAGDDNTIIGNNENIKTKTGSDIPNGTWNVLKFIFIDGISYQI